MAYSATTAVDPWKPMHDSKARCVELARAAARAARDYEGPRTYVQLASFLDPQLLPTIEDMLDKADRPEAFTFGLCWQYGKDEDPDAFDGVETFRVYKAHYSESTGLGWARHVTNAMWAGEEFTLQLDSHHRFARHWDTMMREDYEQARALFGAEKPVITTYSPQYCPYEPMPPAGAVPGQPLPFTPTLMAPYEFTPERLLMSRVDYLPNFHSLDRVVRTRTISAHLIFTVGRFCREVEYDPEVYYGGPLEEQNVSARAFTSGYDFFSPHRVWIVHDYSRRHRLKLWDTKDTSGLEAEARRRVRKLLHQEDNDVDLGRYGLGAARTFQEYQEFIGIDFKNHRLSERALDRLEPEAPKVPFEELFKTREFLNVTASWDADAIRRDCDASTSPLKCVTLGFQSSTGSCLHRADMLRHTHPDVFELKQATLTASFKSYDRPTKWVLYTAFEDGTWGSRQEGAC